MEKRLKSEIDLEKKKLNQAIDECRKLLYEAINYDQQKRVDYLIWTHDRLLEDLKDIEELEILFDNEK